MLEQDVVIRDAERKILMKDRHDIKLLKETILVRGNEAVLLRNKLALLQNEHVRVKRQVALQVMNKRNSWIPNFSLALGALGSFALAQWRILTRRL
jgi:hypothetical protein